MDLKELKEILQILEEKEIEEFELEEEGMKLRIRKAAVVSPNHHGAPPPAMAPFAAPPAAAPHLVPGPAPAAPAEAAPAPGEAGLVLVRSPMVGTFFRSPDPNSPAFVNTGDRVKVGQVLCIIEAMKLMNEIEAEVAGEIVKVHHENGQPVQYGEALFSLRPDR